MEFNDVIFIFNFFTLAIIYSFIAGRFRVPSYIRKCILAAGNIIFCLFGGYKGLLFLCAYSVIVFLVCRLLLSRSNKMLFVLSVITAAAPLSLIKTGSFSYIIPIGISVFSFEAISLISDVYNNRVKKVTLIDVVLYLSFFVTVRSGPIMRYNRYTEGLYSVNDRDDGYDPEKTYKAFERFVIGLSKKLLIADRVAPLADYYFDGIAAGNTYSAAGLWIGAIAYTVQIYFDFSGYTDMSIAVGSLLGFSIPENFNKPYSSRSISDFWNRWHISLTDWFRDYIYIPLGGNRCSIPRHILNLLIVWIVTSVWHGWNLTFLVWGMGYFAILVAEKYISGFRHVLENSKWGHVYSLFIINGLWVAFRSRDLGSMAAYYKGMFGLGQLFSVNVVHIEGIVIMYLPYMGLLVMVGILCFAYGRMDKKRLTGIVIVKNVLLMVIFAVSICAAANSSYVPYIYGKF